MDRPKYEPGEFALVEGQVVEIIDRKIGYNDMCDYYTYKVRLLDTRLTNWLYEPEISPISNQSTPQILYGRKDK